MKKLKYAFIAISLFLVVLTGCGKKSTLDDMRVWYEIEVMSIEYNDEVVKNLYIGQNTLSIRGHVDLILNVSYDDKTWSYPIDYTTFIDADEDNITYDTKFSIGTTKSNNVKVAKEKFEEAFEDFFGLKIKKYQKNARYKEIIAFLENEDNIPTLIPEGQIIVQEITETIEVRMDNANRDFGSQIVPYETISYERIQNALRQNNQMLHAIERYGVDFWDLIIDKDKVKGVAEEYKTDRGIILYQEEIAFEYELNGIKFIIYLDLFDEDILRYASINLGNSVIDFDKDSIEYDLEINGHKYPIVDNNPEISYNGNYLTYKVDLSDAKYFFIDELIKLNKFPDRNIVFNNKMDITVDIPDFEVAKFEEAKANTQITLTTHLKDGDFTTSALGSSENVFVKAIIANIFDDSFIRNYGTAKEEIYTYERYLSSLNGIEFTDQFKVSKSYLKLELELNNAYQNEYYQGDESFIINEDTVFTCHSVYRVQQYLDNSFTREYVSLSDITLSGFDSETVGSKEMIVSYKNIDLKLPYTIKEDLVSEIVVKNGSFAGLNVLHEDIDLTDTYITVTYESGRVKDLPVTNDMLSNLPTTSGINTITINYQGKSTTQEINVYEVKNITLYEGLNTTYVLNEKPQEVEVKVEFTNDEYDIYLLTSEDLKNFDTSKEGNNTWSWSFGQVEFSHSYKVLGNVYITYILNSDNQYIINGYTAVEPTENYFKLDDPRDVIIPSTIQDLPVIAISDSTFSGISSIRYVEIPEGVLTIGDYAFEDCVALTEVKLPLSATLGKTILQGATSLQKLYVNGNQSLYDIIGKTECLELNVIVEGSTLIDNFLCENVKNIKELTFGDNVTTLGEQEYLAKVATFSSTSDNVIVDNNIIYTDAKEVLYYYPTNHEQKVYVTPSQTKTIKYFDTNNYLEELTLSAAIEAIPEMFLANSENLTSVKFEGTLKVLPNSAFSNCNKLSQFIFPKGLEEISSHVLSGSNLQTIIVPQGVTKIAQEAFYGSKCEKLYIPSSASNSLVKVNGYGEFYLPKLTTLAYDGSIKFKNSFFYSAYQKSTIQNIYITGEATKLHQDMLYQINVTSLNLYLAKNITSVDEYMTGESGSYGMIPINIYCEGTTSVSKSYSSVTVTKNYTYEKWWQQ